MNRNVVCELKSILNGIKNLQYKKIENRITVLYPDIECNQIKLKPSIVTGGIGYGKVIRNKKLQTVEKQPGR